MAINLGPLAKHHVDTHAGCRKYAEEAGWDCYTVPFLEYIEGRSPRSVSSYDGVVGRITQQMADEARCSGTPVVNVWANSPVKDLPSVFSDFEAAGAMGANHLLGRGFRNFGLFTGLNSTDSIQLKGFRSALKAAGMDCSVYRERDLDLDFAKTGALDSIIDSQEAWIDTWQRPIGILCADDTTSRYLIDVCQSKGLHVPGDVAVVGAGNEEAICLAQSPTITSIELGFGQIGYHAAQLLDRLMDGEQPPDQPILINPHELVPRQSTDSFAIDDPLVARALRFITEHCCEQIKVTDVVAAVPTSRRSLERLFQKTMQRTIDDEILRLRIEHAKRILVETDEALKNVARASGFSNYTHFYRAFVRLMEMSPKEYRKQSR